MNNVWVTTTDNKNNPFTNFDDWYDYDTRHGYNTCGYLDRVIHVNDISELSEDVADMALDSAINDIVRFDLTNTEGVHYIKVHPADYKDEDPDQVK